MIMAASDLAGVKLTTSEVKSITEDIKGISSDLDDIMGNFKNIMSELTGQSEGGLIEQTVVAAEQLYDGVIALAKCFLDLGLKIGEYLNAMLTGDQELAMQLREQIER